MPSRFGLTTLTILLIVLVPLSLILAIRTGSVSMSWQELWLALQNSGSAVHHSIIYDLRLPRALAAFAVGGMLALAGVLLQVLLRNPLADPYIMGISGGAAVAALLATLAGLSGILLTSSAFTGGLIAMLIVFGLAHKADVWTPTRLLLTGVVVAAGWGAIISFILAIAPSQNVQGMLFWLMGDLSQAHQPVLPLIILAIGSVASYQIARALNLLARGELTAAVLGENPLRLKIVIYLIASLVTAAAVTVAGSIAFVGLVIPHMMRLLGSSDHRQLIPNAILFGGSFLVIADTIARVLMAPTQLPVGVITAFIGVPLFLVLLNQSQRS